MNGRRDELSKQPQEPETKKRSPGRPPKKPSPWEPLNVSPEALAQAVLRPPKPMREE